MKPIKKIYITGTGACGFLEANSLLKDKYDTVYKSEHNKYQNAFVEQGNLGFPIWDKMNLDEKNLNEIIEKILKQSLISHILIQYIEELVESDPEITILCLQAPKSATVRNLVWSWGFANPLVSSPRINRREINRYPLLQFPDYSHFGNLVEATSHFYDNFYEKAYEFSLRFPKNFQLIQNSNGLGEAFTKLGLIDSYPPRTEIVKEMFTTNLNGGLGNILFQISEALIFAKEFGYPEPVFGYWEEDRYSSFPKFYKPDKKFGGHEVNLSDFNDAFENISIQQFYDVNFDTHFQVSNMFNFCGFSGRNDSGIRLKSNGVAPLKVAALHMRFGGQHADISAIPKIRKRFYRRVFRRLPRGIPVYIYSDNSEKARNWIATYKRKFERELILRELSAIESLIEMANCEYHILHSSTFSFWSAYLDPNQPNAKVYFPREFEDLHGPNMIPYDSWVRL